MTHSDWRRVRKWLQTDEAKGLKPLDRVMLLEFAYHAENETGVSWVSEQRVCAIWGYGSRAVRYAVARLHDLGLLDTMESGAWRRSARRVLTGPVARVNQGAPYEAESDAADDGHRVNQGAAQGEPQFRHRVNQGAAQGEPGFTRDQVHHVNRQVQHDDDSDADADGRTGAGRPASDDKTDRQPSAVSPEVLAEAAAKLECGEHEAADWAAGIVARFKPNNPDAYIRRCIKGGNVRPNRPKKSKRQTSKNADGEKCAYCFNNEGYALGDDAEYHEGVWWHPECWAAVNEPAAPPLCRGCGQEFTDYSTFETATTKWLIDNARTVPESAPWPADGVAVLGSDGQCYHFGCWRDRR